jgi:thiamine-phosphate pyrophosphorylase
MKLRGLYAITDETLTPYEQIDRYIKEAIAGGAKIVQLRDKNLSDEELYPVAKKIKKICKKHKALFVLDDRVVLAKAINADGVHIGDDDTPIELARQILGSKKIIGVSCYGDIERAKDAVKKSADYVAFGAFFASKTKPHAQVVSPSVLREAKKLGVSVCAIGGIEPSNAKELVQSGADMLSVISALWSGDVKQNAKEFGKVFSQCR